MTEKMIAAGIPGGYVLLTAALVRRMYRRQLRRAVSVHCNGCRVRYVLSGKCPFTFRKRARIRPEYYERMRRITARCGGLSSIVCADNVLRAHFEDRRECIDRCRLPEKPFNGTRLWKR